MDWAERDTGIGGKCGACRVLMGKPEKRKHLKDLPVDWTVILKWNFKKWDRVAWTGFMWPRIEIYGGGGCWECGDERLGSVKCVEFLD